jgi:type I restriction enzyme M protein
MNDVVENPVYRKILRSIDLLRNLFSPSEVIQYIVALIFLRWLVEQKVLGSSGHKKVRLCPSVPLGRFIELNVPERLRAFARIATPLSTDFGDIINSTFRDLELTNSIELKDVFADLNFSNSKFGDPQNSFDLLASIVSEVWDLEFPTAPDQNPANPLACYFDLVTDPFISGLYSAEFNTPRSICSLVAKLMAPSHQDKIYDPACGTGKLLLSIAKEAEITKGTVELAGTEINHAAWSLAKLNVLSHGYSSGAIERGDSLAPAEVPSRHGEQLKFDIVVAHPPWSMRWDAEFASNDKYGRFKFGVPPAGNADYAFILHMVSSMRPDGGRMAVVVSNGVLSRSGREAEIRERLIRENLIEAVIALPDKLFKGTSIASAILILKSSREHNSVQFIDSRKIANLGRSQNSLSNNAIQHLVDIYHGRAIDDDISVFVPQNEIIRNDFSLRFALYEKTTESSVNRCGEEIRNDILVARVDLTNITEQIDDAIDLLNAK